MLPGSVVAIARSARPIAPSSAFATIADWTPRRRNAGRVPVPKTPSTPFVITLAAAPAGSPSMRTRYRTMSGWMNWRIARPIVSTTSGAGASGGAGIESGTAKPSTVARRKAASSWSPVRTSTCRPLVGGIEDGTVHASSFSKPFNT